MTPTVAASQRGTAILLIMMIGADDGDDYECSGCLILLLRGVCNTYG